MSSDCSNAIYAILVIQRLQGRGQVPIAVLLIDPVEDKLRCRFRQDIERVLAADESEDSVLDVIDSIEEMLLARAQAEGALKLIRELGNSLSNYMKLSPLSSIERPVDWDSAIDLIYRNQVSNRS
jgi:hypothetical protein